MKAIWNDHILAESEETIVIENNCYFPPSSVHRQYFSDSATTTVCSWKGIANYYTIEVDGEMNVDAAWCYQSPKDAASEIKNYIAFWKGVEILE